ncbi:hypothetical protein HDV00_004388 [Rhizophlyctis rosea]|nr:hypothetical protein HDV00_004388 [Rhizophlyctis rosea]
MSKFVALSGTWSGSYTYGFNNVSEAFSTSLIFENGIIKGSGTDRAGNFTIQGFLFEQTGSITMNKIYRTHTVAYNGNVQDGVMRGTWMIDSRNTGSFVLTRSIERSKLGTAKATFTTVAAIATGASVGYKGFKLDEAITAANADGYVSPEELANVGTCATDLGFAALGFTPLKEPISMVNAAVNVQDAVGGGDARELMDSVGSNIAESEGGSAIMEAIGGFVMSIFN